VRVYLGSDHAGLELKSALIEWLASAGHEPEDDYPPYVMRAARRAVEDLGSLGIVIGGSGNGEQIASNKIPGVRAALAFSDETARLARQHNNANVLSLGAREYPVADAVGFAQVFVQTPFSGEARHVRRLDMITEYEKTHELPPLPPA
jgi:ribose 5-phosphate isomerase B